MPEAGLPQPETGCRELISLTGSFLFSYSAIQPCSDGPDCRAQFALFVIGCESVKPTPELWATFGIRVPAGLLGKTSVQTLFAISSPASSCPASFQCP